MPTPSIGEFGGRVWMGKTTSDEERGVQAGLVWVLLRIDRSEGWDGKTH